MAISSFKSAIVSSFARSTESILESATETSEVLVIHLVVVPFQRVEAEHSAEVICGLFDPECFEEVESS